MAALGGCSISRSEVSRICALLDEELAEFRDRPLDEPYPYVWFDATHEKVRQGARIVSQAAVVAVGVSDSGEKSVLGLAVGASETEAFWLEFCRSLSRRGLSGVQLVISDAHEGLRSALSQVFAGATWQRHLARAGTGSNGDRRGVVDVERLYQAGSWRCCVDCDQESVGIGAKALGSEVQQRRRVGDVI
jgi:transposase-like protein